MSRARTLTSAECLHALRALRWGMLATIDIAPSAGGAAGSVDAVAPYTVPINFALAGETIVFASGPGRKLANLERDPSVCLSAISRAGPDDWVSVVVMGRAARVAGVAEVARAVAALGAIAAEADGSWVERADRLRRGVMFRIEVAEMSGRERGGALARLLAGEERGG